MEETLDMCQKELGLSKDDLPPKLRKLINDCLGGESSSHKAKKRPGKDNEDKCEKPPKKARARMTRRSRGRRRLQNEVAFSILS